MLTVLPKDTLGMLDAFPFMMDNVVYDSIYQRIVCERALLANDSRAYRDLRGLTDPDALDARAARIPNDVTMRWEQCAYDVCVRAVRAKYQGACRHELLTPGKFMYICDDMYWGTAGSEAGAMIGVPFRGQNMYGKALETVRHEIKQEQQPQT